MEKQNNNWYDFVFTKQFQLVMTGVKIIAMLALVGIFYLVFTEIQAVKFLNYDACAYCVDKTGAQCFKLHIG